jgi:RimJ/RimL family protein N-acetyltransferase
MQQQQIGFPVGKWSPPPRPSADVMAGRLCRLEPLAAELHSADLFAASQLDPEGRNWTYLPYGPFATPADYHTWVEGVAGARDPMFFAIIDLATGRAVGVASYLRIKPQQGSIEVGHIHLSPLLQRKPAATEAMYLMMKLVFDLGYRRYEWKCDALNAVSRKAALRLGLSFEGIFRQATMYKQRNRDTAWYAAIDQEWPELEKAFTSWLNPSNFDTAGHQRVSLSSLTAGILKSVG